MYDQVRERSKHEQETSNTHLPSNLLPIQTLVRRNQRPQRIPIVPGIRGCAAEYGHEISWAPHYPKTRQNGDQTPRE